MILVSFTNMYMNGIHAGIQTAHVVHTLMSKYQAMNPSDSDVARGLDVSTWELTQFKLRLWESDHKTIYVKRGGDHEGLWSQYSQMADLCRKANLPYARWAESKGALNGALTAICFVATSDVLESSKIDEVNGLFPPTPEMELNAMIRRASFAS